MNGQLDTDDWKAFNAENNVRKINRRKEQTEEITRLAQKGFLVVKITDYQYRINAILDIYPTNKKFHNIATGKRGKYFFLSQLIQKQLDK